MIKRTKFTRTEVIVGQFLKWSSVIVYIPAINKMKTHLHIKNTTFKQKIHTHTHTHINWIPKFCVVVLPAVAANVGLLGGDAHGEPRRSGNRRPKQKIKRRRDGGGGLESVTVGGTSEADISVGRWSQNCRGFRC